MLACVEIFLIFIILRVFSVFCANPWVYWLLTHFMPLISFETPWKGGYQEISGMKWVNNQYTQGIPKEISGMKWVKYSITFYIGTMKNKDIHSGDNLAKASEKEFKTVITLKLFQNNVSPIYFWSRYYLFFNHLSQRISIKNNLHYWRVTKWWTAKKNCWRNLCFSKFLSNLSNAIFQDCSE